MHEAVRNKKGNIFGVKYIPHIVILKSGRTDLKKDFVIFDNENRENLVEGAIKELQGSIKQLEHIIHLDSQDTYDKHCH